MITIICNDGRRRRFFRNENKQSLNHKRWICRECGRSLSDTGLKSARPELAAHICIKKL